MGSTRAVPEPRAQGAAACVEPPSQRASCHPTLCQYVPGGSCWARGPLSTLLPKSQPSLRTPPGTPPCRSFPALSCFSPTSPRLTEHVASSPPSIFSWFPCFLSSDAVQCLPPPDGVSPRQGGVLSTCGASPVHAYAPGVPRVGLQRENLTVPYSSPSTPHCRWLEG